MIDSGYRDITGRIEHLLAESPLADIRTVRIEQDGNRIVMHGNVRSFYLKQMAQETVRRVSSNLQIVNSINVD